MYGFAVVVRTLQGAGKPRAAFVALTQQRLNALPTRHRVVGVLIRSPADHFTPKASWGQSMSAEVGSAQLQLSRDSRNRAASHRSASKLLGDWLYIDRSSNSDACLSPAQAVRLHF